MTETSNPNAAPQARRSNAVRIVLGCFGFIALLLVVLTGVDRVMGHLNRNRHWDGLLGWEVYRAARERSIQKNTVVHTIYLGDSVARQLFWPGHDPVPTVQYLTTNQAVGVAGQFYLLRNATAHDPNLRNVFLMYTPRSWANQLEPPALTKDYFCEFFNTPEEIAQIFRLKRDPELAASQISRWLLPNLLAANSASSLALYAHDAETPVAPPSTGPPGDTPDKPRAEPILHAIASVSQRLSPSPLASSVPAGGPIFVSPLSAYFLDQIRSWCRTHRLQLRVIPCPCIATRSYAPEPSPYDAPLWYLPAAYFRDGIHFINPKIAPVREEMIKRYALPQK